MSITQKLITNLETLSIKEKTDMEVEMETEIEMEMEMEMQMEMGMEIDSTNTSSNKKMKLFYNDYKSFQQFQTELGRELFENEFDIYNCENIKYRKIVLDIPNYFSNQKKSNLDIEDYIYTDLELPNHINKIIYSSENTVDNYVLKFIVNNNININFHELKYNLDDVFAKTLYIFQFVSFYYTKIHILSFGEILNEMPNTLMQWTDNLIKLINAGLKTKFITYEDTQSKSNKIKEDYYEELCYGLNLCICHLKMIINHCNLENITLLYIDKEHITKFFRLLNNLCIIIIFMRLN